MNRTLWCAFVLLTLQGQIWAVPGIRQEQVSLKPGKNIATLTGRMTGRKIVDYRLRASAGQVLTVSLKSTNRFNYFNILPPGDDSALFVGSSSGNRYRGALPTTGEYSARVYLMSNAARRNEVADFTVGIEMAGGPKAANPGLPTNLGGVRKPFDDTLALQGIRFRVTCANEGSINILRIIPEGLEIDNSEIVRTVDGIVTGAEVADLNADGSPEIYVYVNSAGSGSYGALVAYAANRRKSLSEIHLPSVTQNKKAAQGYQGHDEFAVVESSLVRRFPVYRQADMNAKPTGGMRQLQYKLRRSESGWRLALEKMLDY